MWPQMVRGVSATLLVALATSLALNRRSSQPFVSGREYLAYISIADFSSHRWCLVFCYYLSCAQSAACGRLAGSAVRCVFMERCSSMFIQLPSEHLPHEEWRLSVLASPFLNVVLVHLGTRLESKSTIGQWTNVYSRSAPCCGCLKDLECHGRARQRL